ncbi:transposase [Agrilactobacillus fermenti]|uniref:transposase n=3 Tax=Agrilactobacillus fermenti TaxID=2586909 RepID=UPI003A5BD90D
MYQNYNNNQLCLSIPLEINISSNHVAVAISHFVDSIPDKLIYEKAMTSGRPAYNPAMLLKVILFAYTRQNFSGRKIEAMAQENIPTKWLIGDPDTVPSYRTINRFRSSDQMKRLVEAMFLSFRQLLKAQGLIDDSALFIDGTKLLADANKYTFVWRKASERFEGQLDKKIAGLYQELVQNKVDLAMSDEAPKTDSKTLEKTSEQLTNEIERLDQVIATEPIIPGGSPNKRLRRKFKHDRHLIDSDYLPRKRKYESNNAIFGDRNSFLRLIRMQLLCA